MSNMKDRILNNQKEHHEMLSEYFRLTELIEDLEGKRRVLVEAIYACKGAMRFVAESRAEMRAEKGDDADEE